MTLGFSCPRCLAITSTCELILGETARQHTVFRPFRYPGSSKERGMHKQRKRRLRVQSCYANVEAQKPRLFSDSYCMTVEIGRLPDGVFIFIPHHRLSE